MNRQDLKNKQMPDMPGVYFFKNKKDILYIGKATSLRDRVRSYFMPDLIATRGPLLVDMLFKADDIEWQETDSVLEALILEADLIKKYQPHYNTKEKDNKSFNYVVITNEEWPRVLLVRGRNLSVASEMEELKVKYKFGPFPNGLALREALRIIRKIFPFIDRASVQKDKYEFYRQLRLTPDTASEEAKEEYKNTIHNIKLFFEGKKKKIISELKKKMNDHAKRLEFEEAQKIKKTIFALEHINDVSLIKADREVSVRPFRIEAYDIAHMSGKNMVGVMTVVENGEPQKSEYRKFIIKSQENSNDAGALKEVLTRRFGHPEWTLPDLIVMDGNIIQQNAAQAILTEYTLSIPIVSVVKDDRHKAREILGSKEYIHGREQSILLANSEAHRFGITFHRKKRDSKFLPKK